MKFTSDPVLRKIALEAAQQVTTDTGRIYQDELLEALCERLAPRKELLGLVIKKAGQAMMRDLGERHSPRRHRTTDGLYHPKSIMKLGNGIWVWMKDSTATDMTEWGRISSRNFVRTATAEAHKQDYVGSRSDAYRENPHCERLSMLEESVFGYQQESFDDLGYDFSTA
ncbi:hypothetical protein SZN_15818 [Streptomyces zinciresistens K42]|uniref:Uncharacterized protein n=1 Tax=Streptomyces zinciresistens K42 TaxID=700597 RepID=G2GCD9_9ACTN|nr:hypothetical protein [Streptomyces zinciresistens]EGX58828.1 hypothetical protein SZN_15818 [Streptomyces zinciresistens K42]